MQASTDHSAGAHSVSRGPAAPTQDLASPTPNLVAPAHRSDGHVGARRWLRRLGVAGFLFFLIKGILWLLIPAVVFVMGEGCLG